MPRTKMPVDTDLPDPIPAGTKIVTKSGMRGIVDPTNKEDRWGYDVYKVFLPRQEINGWWYPDWVLYYTKQEMDEAGVEVDIS